MEFPIKVLSLAWVEAPAATSTKTLLFFFNPVHMNWKNLQRKAGISQMGNLQVVAVRMALSSRRNNSHKSDTNHTNKLR